MSSPDSKSLCPDLTPAKRLPKYMEYSVWSYTCDSRVLFDITHPVSGYESATKLTLSELCAYIKQHGHQPATDKCVFPSISMLS